MINLIQRWLTKKSSDSASEFRAGQWVAKFARNRLTGLTLIELLVTLAILSVVILVSWSGLIATLNMSSVAEARSARKVELNQALDFMSDEIRSATRINQSASKRVGVDTLRDVVQDAGVNLADLGPYGSLALYLEHQLLPERDPICPAGTPNAGQPKVMLDRVVYDVRPSPSGWLNPLSIVRYGRIPVKNAQFDPCSNPVSSDVLIDSIAQVPQLVPCANIAQVSGQDGFQVCTKDSGNSVDLHLQSAISGDEFKPLVTTVTGRQFYGGSSVPNSATSLVQPLALTIDSTVPGELTLSWPNSGSGQYTLMKSQSAGDNSLSTVYQGSAQSFTDMAVSSGEIPCYQLIDDANQRSQTNCVPVN